MAADADAFEKMFSDPEIHDEDDPAYREELFETLKAMGHGPERVKNDPVFAREYAEWLAKNP